MAFGVTLAFNQIEDYEKDDSQAENSVRIGIVSCWHAADADAVFLSISTSTSCCGMR